MDNFCEIYAAAFVNDPDLQGEELWVVNYCQCGASNSTITDPNQEEQNCFELATDECTLQSGCAAMNMTIDERVPEVSLYDYCFNLTHYLSVVFPTAAQATDFLMLAGSDQRLMNSYNWCTVMNAGFSILDVNGRLHDCEAQSTFFPV